MPTPNSSPQQAQPQSPFTRLLHHLRFGDFIVAALFLALTLMSMTWGRFNSAPNNAETARVLVRNRVVAELSLLQPDTVAVHAGLGEVRLAITEQSLRILASPCPHQVCVQQGRIQRAPQILVCVPNHLVVLLLEKKGSALDAVTY